jgi:sugar phosphate permease
VNAESGVSGFNPTTTPEHRHPVYNKTGLRIIPFLFVGYVFAYIDRIKVDFAQLQLKTELGFSDSVYGLAAGLFFATYFLFEIPSNLLLQRIGARLTITRIPMCWGLVSSAMMFVRTPGTFAMRLLLGVFEAGFAPGAMLYLTYWYPSSRLVQVSASFLCGITGQA